MEFSSLTSSGVKSKSHTRLGTSQFSPLNSDSFIQGYHFEKRRMYRNALDEKIKLTK